MSAIHRKNPGPPALPDGVYRSDDPLLKARAFRAVGELGLVDYQITVSAPTPRPRIQPCGSGPPGRSALLNGKGCRDLPSGIAEAGGPFAERAAQMAMRRLPPNDAKIWLKRLVKELAADADRRSSPPAPSPTLRSFRFLIDQMKVPKLARVAGESFSLITGANIAYEDLDGEKPEGFEAGPTENPEDENVAMDSDLNLPWPDPALIQKWWKCPPGRFRQGHPLPAGPAHHRRTPFVVPSRMASSASEPPPPSSWPSSSPATPSSKSAPGVATTNAAVNP